MKKNYPAYLFWGGVWGICEASIGYVLHIAAVLVPGLPGALMFPIGFWCMYQARKATDKTTAPFYIAFIAAAVKLVNFLIPGHDVIRIVNPALSILLEGLAVTAVYALFMGSGRVADYLKVLGMSILWRAMFSLYLLIISLFDLPAGLVTSGMGVFLRFILLESFLNSVILYAGLRLAPKLPHFTIRTVKPVAALIACLAAVSLELLL